MFCMLCGSPTREVKGKLECESCRRIVESCCEGYGEKVADTADSMMEEMREIAAELNDLYGSDAISPLPPITEGRDR